MYFDSQNGFGALNRTNFVAKMRYNGDQTWSLIEFDAD